MQKNTNGSSEPEITIRGSLKKAKSSEEYELVLFFARKKKPKPAPGQTMLDEFIK